MAGVILAVTPNPAVDVTYRLDRLRPGEVHRVAEVVSRAGGKGVNLARVLAHLGRRCEALLVGSGGAAERVQAELAAEGVPVTLVGRMPLRRTLVVHAADGTVTSLWEPGTLPEDLPARVAALAAARGVPAVLDLDGAALAAAVAGGAAVLTPNTDELERLTGRRPATAAEAAALATGLVATAVPMVVATLGAEGLVVARRGAPVLHARLREPVTGNPTGAGDAVCAAVASALAAAGSVDAADPADLARHAVAVGAAAVLRPVAGEVDRGDVDRLLAEVEVRPA